MRIVISILAFLLSFGASVARAEDSVATSQPLASPAGKAAVVAIEGEINNYTLTTLKNRVAQARSAGARTIILRINTYGGLVTSALEISHFIKSQNDMTFIAYVREKAISAGALIALACNGIVMQHNSKIGDCAPISVSTQGSLESMGPAERAKMESPIRADFYDSSVRNKYDVLLTEAMVTVGRVVHWVEDEKGNRKFVGEEEFQKLNKAGWKTVADAPDPLDGADTLLTLNDDLARRVGISRASVRDEMEFATRNQYSIVASYEATFGDQVIEFLGSGLMRFILLTVFPLSLYAVLHAPGHGAAEVICIVSLGLLVGIPLLTGYANWWEILAIISGLVLLAMEIFVIPGFGVAGILGIILLVGGMVSTFVPSEPLPGVWPKFSGTWVNLQRGLLIVTSGLICSMFLAAWLRKYLPELPYFKRLVLAAPGGSKEIFGSKEGIWPGIGAHGAAVTELKPGGSAEFIDLATNDRRIISVVSESGYLPIGTPLIVTLVEGNRVSVKSGLNKLS